MNRQRLETKIRMVITGPNALPITYTLSPGTDAPPTPAPGIEKEKKTRPCAASRDARLPITHMA